MSPFKARDILVISDANPLSANIHKQVLLAYLHTFSYCISWENLLKDINIFPLVLILLILVTFSVDYVLILLGENRCWSLLARKGLILSECARAALTDRFVKHRILLSKLIPHKF